MRALLIALVLVLTAGCSGGPPSDLPEDFAGTFTYTKGSVPPKYHYEWTLTFTATDATVAWRPGYDEATQPWTTTTPITAEARATFYRTLRDAGALQATSTNRDGGVGGSTGSLTVTADGETYGSPRLGTNRDNHDLLEAIHDAAVDLLPAAVWDEFEQRQQDWGAGS
ncbi:hypothetical protein SAMN05192558_101786 [Actinokineospora alba]|uniref:Lipoprotein n=1 Tax=Actinokineospora alba TaxID=504798 RepID=A0A1H0GGD4_9PSEU|nr:hypothetical protein [Actinokineospora alba]TDP69883.1 hypothetical protein C8E96_5479 [Actinokineospora alba]SDI06703.1 hypothetical protein SAMN05421871_10385 [Actinokineospora alba]SDO05903.1 hypothetical protein SAMN05192558_101786 [Actinokineospora alba]